MTARLRATARRRRARSSEATWHRHRTWHSLLVQEPDASACPAGRGTTGPAISSADASLRRSTRPSAGGGSAPATHLAKARPADLVEVADGLVGIHATDPASVYLGSGRGCATSTRDGLGAVLYEDRALLKVLGMRRTMFVDARGRRRHPGRDHGDLSVAERKRLLGMLEGAGITKDRPDAGWRRSRPRRSRRSTSSARRRRRT